MRICLIGKYPPIQGGVSAQTYWFAHQLAEQGHQVHLVTNANEVELGYRQTFLEADFGKLETKYQYGYVRCHNTTVLDTRSYIPWSKPFATKLFGLAISVVEEFNCDLIFGSYFEPYSFVAVLAGNITKRPVIVKHAGSDIGRLAYNSDLAKSYKWLLKNANGVITNRRLASMLIEMGAREETLVFPRLSRLPQDFLTQQVTFDLGVYLGKTSEWLSLFLRDSNVHEEASALNQKPLDKNAITIGTYGKVGVTKGSFDLLNALKTLAISGLKFNFLSIIAGTPLNLKLYLESLTESSHLTEKSWLLPPLPPWRIPGFLHCCDAVCFLERNFPIEFHTPGIPREIISSGACLVCSREIAEKQIFRESLADGKNFILIDDPRDIISFTQKLRDLIVNFEKTRTIGRHGFYLSQFFEANLPESTSNTLLEELAKKCSSPIKVRH